MRALGGGGRGGGARLLDRGVFCGRLAFGFFYLAVRCWARRVGMDMNMMHGWIMTLV